ncbi:MAG: PilN domain-containing protein [Simplicispira sp.]|nr:PilN domain-containing protein [Simplicispira sp.]
MSPTTTTSRFFGLDLRALWLEVRRPWQDMHQWRALAWLTPDVPVRVLHPDGRDALWLGNRPAPAGTPAARFEAIALPDDKLLARRLTVPAMAAAQVAQAVALDVHSASPFAPADLVWGYSTQPLAQGALQVDAVLASRKQITQFIEAQQHRLGTAASTGAAAHAPEVWAFTPAGQPMVLAGWGEARRAHYAAQRRRLGYTLLFSATAIVAALAITPTAQLRLRAIEAVNTYTETQRRTAPLMAQREVLVRSIERMNSVRALLLERPDPIALLELLTQTLPDDTSLQSIQVQGLKVTINGLTANAAALMQLLGTTAGFKEVRAPSAATRSPGATAESFLIEFQLDPAVLSAAGPAPVAEAPVPEPEPGSAPASDAAVLGTPAAPAAAVPPASTIAAPPGAAPPASPTPAAAPGAAPARKSPFSSGPEPTLPAKAAP